jgi:hypothetical protein
MKNAFKFLGINAGLIILILTIGLSFTACDSSGSGGGSTTFGETLSLSGQMYVNEIAIDGHKYIRFTGDRLVFAKNSVGGEGAITKGQLGFSIDIPGSLYSIAEEFDELDNVTINPPSTQCALLELITDEFEDLAREYITTSIKGDMIVVNMEEVSYVYVDQDVNVKADRTVKEAEGFGITLITTYNALNINLKEGWNALLLKGVMEISEEGMIGTFTTSVANPGSLRWVLETDDDDDDNSMSMRRSITDNSQAGNAELQMFRQLMRNRKLPRY